MRFILASASPRRKELLRLIVPEFEIITSSIEEKLKEGLTPQEQATNLAYKKAKDIYERTEGDRIVIGADTIVTKKGKIYGKPKDKNNAKQMIKELLGGDRTHNIITGLCVIINKEGIFKEYKLFDEVKVFLNCMSDNEIDRWLETGNAMDKAGAYGMQNEFCAFVNKIYGNYTTAIGLPTHKLYDIIKEYIEY